MLLFIECWSDFKEAGWVELGVQSRSCTTVRSLFTVWVSVGRQCVQTRRVYKGLQVQLVHSEPRGSMRVHINLPLWLYAVFVLGVCQAYRQRRPVNRVAYVWLRTCAMNNQFHSFCHLMSTPCAVSGATVVFDRGSCPPTCYPYSGALYKCLST